jgi:hypothetical protein
MKAIMSNKKPTSAFWQRRKLEADIYLPEVFRRPRTIRDVAGLLLTLSAVAAALCFVVAMPSWPIRHNAANMTPRTVQTIVDDVRWVRPLPRNGFGMTQSAAFRIEGAKVEWSVPNSVKRGDKLTVIYAVDADGRVLIVKVTPL